MVLMRLRSMFLSQDARTAPTWPDVMIFSRQSEPASYTERANAHVVNSHAKVW